MSDDGGDNPPPKKPTDSGEDKATKQEDKAPPPTEATEGTGGTATEGSATEESETEESETEESDTESAEEESAETTETGNGETSEQEDEVLPPEEAEDDEGEDTEEGGWQGEDGLRLDAQENAAADGFLEQAENAEPSITPVVMDIRDNIPGAETEGYPEHVLKDEDSFKRKLATELNENPDMDVDEALGNMKDSVRYTMTFPNEGTSYADGVNDAMQRLTDAGMEPVGFRNTWDEPGYQGINSWWRDPATGHTFEMQFHTPESFAAKMETHDLYKQQRLPGVTPEQQAALQQQQDQIFDAVPRPPGASSIRPPDDRRE